MTLLFPLFDHNQIAINWLTRGGQAEGTSGWSSTTSSWQGGTITYNLPEFQHPFYFWLPNEDNWEGFVPPGDNQFDGAVEAFELWDDLIAVDLNFSDDYGANILLSHSTTISGAGHAATTAVDTDGDPGDLEIQSSHIWFNANDATFGEGAINYGSYGFTGYIHEIGHALGLTHPGNYDANDVFIPMYEFDAGYQEATRQYTVMSYFNAGSDGTMVDHWGPTGPLAQDQWQFAATPLLHDILAIQALYGADMTTRTGNTRYGFNSNAGRDVYDFTKNPNPIIAIWDAGGTDTIDASGFSTYQLIDLNQGAFSNIGHLTKNVAIAFGADIENAVGGSGGNKLIGNALKNTLVGGDIGDVLDGRGGSDVMMGGDGDDIYHVDRGRTVTIIDGTALIDNGDQIIELETATSGHSDKVISSVSYRLADTLENLELAGTANINGTGNYKSNVLTGNSGNNRLSGGNGWDILDGRGGDDVMAGGAGLDTYIVDSMLDQIEELNNGEFDNVMATASFTLSNFVENLTLTGSQHINGTGNDGDNQIWGNSGNNRLEGRGGADTLDGGTGDDTMVGGLGDDTYIIGSWFDQSRNNILGDQIIELAGEGKDTVQSRWDYILGDNIDNLVLGSSGYFGRGNSLNNALHGAKGLDMPNKLEGKGGNDRLFGYEAQDILDGGENNDVLEGGAGSDTLIGGWGRDTASYASSGGGVFVSLTDGVAKGGDADGDTFSSVEDLVGSKFGDRLEGTSGQNVINGGGGSDTMIGKAGNDRYYVQHVDDRAIEATNQGTDHVVSTVSYSLAGQSIEWLTLTGSANINATGNSLANRVVGNNGNNILNGSTGNDFLTGNGGVDFFRFNTALGASNVDTVTDFQVNVDKTQLENAIFTAIGASLTADEFVANANGAATNGSQHILYDTTDGRLFYDADGNGGQARVHFATLNAGLALDHLDFLVM